MATQYRFDRTAFNDWLARLLKAHGIVEDRWQEERPEDLAALRDIYEGHVDDPLYQPLKPRYAVEREWYDEVRREAAQMEHQVDPINVRSLY